jgi:DNA-directed RNA polymerase subunit RPC12/RpoP
MTPDTHTEPIADPAGNYQDGNALAGPLSELFAIDVTAATGHCTECGTQGPVATLRVYTHAPGMVARCPSCDHVVLRVVRGPDSVWLDLRGTVSLRIPLPAPDGA